VGTCLRLIECDETTPRSVPTDLADAVFELRSIAQDEICQAWMFETDPANLQPKVRPRDNGAVAGEPPSPGLKVKGSTVTSSRAATST
jgi:hypothetical protein